jgi:hypothetical protein
LRSRGYSGLSRWALRQKRSDFIRDIRKMVEKKVIWQELKYVTMSQARYPPPEMIKGT